MNVCGAPANVLGLKTNMNPPVLASPHSTCANAGHPRDHLPAEDVEPHVVADMMLKRS